MTKTFIAAVFVALVAIPGMSAAESIIGKPSRLIVSTKNIVTSLSWWTRIGFLPVDPKAKADSTITLTDGQLVITLTTAVLPTPVLVFSTDKIKATKDTLDSLGINSTHDVAGPTYSELRLISPNGVHLIVRPSSTEKLIPVSGDSNRMCGKNTELSIGTGPIKREQRYWETLGFTVKRESKDPYSYALMTDGTATIGLHEARDIVTLTITYFAQNMAERIERIRSAGIEIDTQALASDAKSDNGILTSPEGQRIFLFTGNQ